MPGHVEAAYKDAVDNIIFLKRQQWVATNYALLVYAAIFLIAAQYFNRTDFARNSLGIVAIVTFLVQWYMMYLFQRAIDKFRGRLYWIYRTYFNGEEQAGLDLPLAPQSSWVQWEVATGACPCLIRRICPDCDLFVVSPPTFLSAPEVHTTKLLMQ
jgi:hypothetical protein